MDMYTQSPAVWASISTLMADSYAFLLQARLDGKEDIVAAMSANLWNITRKLVRRDGFQGASLLERKLEGFPQDLLVETQLGSSMEAEDSKQYQLLLRELRSPPLKADFAPFYFPDRGCIYRAN
jgi:hypothetical protein